MLSDVAVYTELAHCPGGQAVVLVQVKDPEAEAKVSAGQGVQVAGPVVLLLVPGAHMVQGTAPPAPVYPALHAHWDRRLLLAGLLVLLGQALESPREQKLLAVQAVQAALLTPTYPGEQ